MTILCAWCNTVLGEKCPSCGSTDHTQLGAIEEGTPQERVLHGCRACRLAFWKGEQTSHTICASCLDRQHAHPQNPLRREKEEKCQDTAAGSTSPDQKPGGVSPKRTP